MSLSRAIIDLSARLSVFSLHQILPTFVLCLTVSLVFSASQALLCLACQICVQASMPRIYNGGILHQIITVSRASMFMKRALIHNPR